MTTVERYYIEDVKTMLERGETVISTFLNDGKFVSIPNNALDLLNEHIEQPFWIRGYMGTGMTQFADFDFRPIVTEAGDLVTPEPYKKYYNHWEVENWQRMQKEKAEKQKEPQIENKPPKKGLLNKILKLYGST